MSATALNLTANQWADDDAGLSDEEIELRDLAYELWRDGDLSWKLDEHQRQVYDQYREWEALDPANDNSGSEMSRIFVMDIARRWGKTLLCLVIFIEDCIRRPGSRVTYATAFQKDISDIIRPLMEVICDDAPSDMEPVFRGGGIAGETMGYFFPILEGEKYGSRIKLVGIDKNPKGLRGRGSDGFCVSEAGFVANLETVVRQVIYPQFQRRPFARMILESNAPEDPEHDFDTFFIPDARLRGSIAERDIDDNKSLDPAEKAEFIRAAGGINHPTCKREYYQIRERNPEVVVVPEFDLKRHVLIIDRPDYARCFVSLDPGLSDLCAVLFGYWHFELAKLVIEQDWAEQNAMSARVADVIRSVESDLWGVVHEEKKKKKEREDPIFGLMAKEVSDIKGWTYWDGEECANPHLRVSDVDKRLITELRSEENLAVVNADKSEGAKTELAKSEPAIHSLRGAIDRDVIAIHPRCKTLISHLNAARWNKQRTDYDRSNKKFGHFDALDALVYMWRAVKPFRKLNPDKPHWVGKAEDMTFIRDEHKERLVARKARVINAILNKKPSRSTNRNVGIGR